MVDNYSQQDQRAGREGWTHHVPVDPVAHAQGNAEREGKPAWPLFGAAGGGGGGVGLLGVLLFAPFIVFAGMLLVPLFPVAGGLTFLFGYILENYVINGEGVAPVMVDIGILLPCIIVLKLSMTLEEKAESHGRYHQVRHWVRVIGLGLGINEIVLPLLGLYLVNRTAAYGWSIFADITFVKLVRVAGSMALIHLIFSWSDTRGSTRPWRARFGLPSAAE